MPAWALDSRSTKFVRCWGYNMSDPAPLPGLVQFKARELRDLANRYRDMVDDDSRRCDVEMVARVKRLYQLRPDLATLRHTFLGICYRTETVFHADGRVESPEDWYASYRRNADICDLLDLPRTRPSRQFQLGDEWSKRVRNLSSDTVVFANADDAGILVNGYTKFPEMDEARVIAFTGTLD